MCPADVLHLLKTIHLLIYSDSHSSVSASHISEKSSGVSQPIQFHCQLQLGGHQTGNRLQGIQHMIIFNSSVVAVTEVTIVKTSEEPSGVKRKQNKDKQPARVIYGQIKWDPLKDDAIFHEELSLSFSFSTPVLQFLRPQFPFFKCYRFFCFFFHSKKEENGMRERKETGNDL